ncbi:MAG: hypothetical protein ACREJ4_16015, partial [Candidatus Methylomirabilaceae bacterium]
ATDPLTAGGHSLRLRTLLPILAAVAACDGSSTGALLGESNPPCTRLYPAHDGRGDPSTRS